MAEPELMEHLRIGAQGRVVLPAVLRKALGLVQGDELVARIVDGSLVLERRDTIERRLRARYAPAAAARSLSGALLADRQRESRAE